MIRIDRVWGSEYEAEQAALQRICLPSDDPVPSHHRWWLALDGGTPVAFGCATFVDGGEAVYLSRAGVLPEYRGQGLQRRLIAARVAWARLLGASVVVCDCTRANVWSANSLIQSGFLLYDPDHDWAGPAALYFRKDLVQ